MARTLTAGMQTEVAAALGETVRLIELQFGGGTLRYTDAAFDLSWNAVTWTAIGGEFSFSPTVESADIIGATTEVSLTAVAGTLAQTIAGESFIGRSVKLYVAKLSQATRLVVADPLLGFSGLMSGGWQITEGVDTVTATVRCVSRLVALTEHRGIQCNLVSHWAHYPTDQFFSQAAQQLTQPVAWGKTYVRLR